MPRLRKTLGVFLGLYILAVSWAQADNPPAEGPGEPGHPGRHIQEIFNQLNLSDDQKKQLEANKQETMVKMQMARREMKIDREALRAELMKPQLNMPKIHALHHQIKSLEAQMEDNKLNSILAVRGILTPEQFSKFAGLMHKFKQEKEAREHENSEK